MTHKLIQEIEKRFINKKTPVIRPGYQIRVHQKIKEGEKERIQVFEGLVIKTNSGHGSSKTITVRKIVEGIGVEKIFPIYSPRIAKIEIKKTLRVRRATLNYLKSKEGMSKRLSAKLGLIERDEALKKKKGLTEEAVAEIVTPEPENNEPSTTAEQVENNQAADSTENVEKEKAAAE
jgi:large subunit ribosomal protein L19